MLSLKTMSNWLSRDRKWKVSPYVKLAFPSPITTHMVSNGEHNPVLQNYRHRLLKARVANFGAKSGYRHGRSRREFLRVTSGMAGTFLVVNRVYGRVFEVHNPEVTVPGFNEAPLDVARFAAEHWNPLMLEELYLGHKRFK